MNELPEGWASTFFGEINCFSPITLNPSQFGDEIFELFSVPSFQNRKPEIVRGKEIGSTKQIVEYDDVLVCKINPRINRVWQVTPKREYQQIASSEWIVMRSPELDASYLTHYFSSAEFRKMMCAEVSGVGGSLTRVQPKRVATFPVKIAPLNEQKRIADKLDALLARVNACRDRLERVSCILKDFRQAVIADATSGKLTQNWRTEHINVSWNREIEDELTKFCFTDAPCFGDFRFPVSWNVARLGEIAEIVGGITKDSKKQDPADEELPYLRVANVQRGFFDLSEIKTIRVPQRRIEELLLSRGDILFNEGGDIDKLGRGWVWDGEIERCTFQNHVFRVRLKNELFEPKFFSWYGNLRGAAYFLSVGKQTTNLASINKSLLSALPIVIPPAEEQSEIVRRIEVLFAYADRIESRYQNALTRVEQLTPTLLSKAFRGELVSQDPDDEPASVLLERIKSEKRRMDSKRKTTRTVRSKTKEKPTSSMPKSLDDCVKALRSAFQQLGGQTDADKLFDQAGFQAEEVVQFYEALQATPEVRVAFEKSTQEYSVQTQSSIAKGGNDHPSQKGSFRLIELWLEDFKNLTDYTVRFDPSHSIDIVLGWNGTGKSNLFEALVIIFRDLYKWWEKNQWTENPMKGYRLRYVMNEKIIEVSWQPGAMKRPKLKMGTLQAGKDEPEQLKSIARQKLLLPRFIFGYYSGPTNRLADHFLPMNQAHYNSLRDAKSDDPETLANLLEKRRFFCAENHHAKYVLLAFFHKEDPAISQFLEERLRIVGFESALFVIRKPRWAKSGNAAEFWGARGVMRRVMERLRRFAIAPMVVKQTVREGYRSRSEEHYYFFLPDLQSLHAFAAEYQDARTFFLALESIDFSELIYDLNIQVRVEATKTEQVAITFHELSEGEQQLLMVLGLMRFTKSHQSLVLLDEPDTHLNPHWSVDYLKLLTRVMSENSGESEEQQTSQILMSTHDPLVIASLLKEQIHLLKRDWQTGACKWDQPTVNPRGLGFTGILTSEMFGMRSDLDEETLADLDTKVRLVAKEDSLTPEEAIELEEVNKRLEDAGFQKAFSDPYYAAFIRAWSRRYSDLMSGTRFLSPDQREEVDQIAGEVLEEILAELQAEVAN
ncbi:restriction endonuclease subunit S [Coleofasciculus chthonoplastes]|uniref:restriction endonuclease subunit S n=1 Tax=Coleofasciculus chthonoplastes TaxID=64178 RepID=UPI0032F91E1B